MHTRKHTKYHVRTRYWLNPLYSEGCTFQCGTFKVVLDRSATSCGTVDIFKVLEYKLQDTINLSLTGVCLKCAHSLTVIKSPKWVIAWMEWSNHNTCMWANKINMKYKEEVDLPYWNSSAQNNMRWFLNIYLGYFLVTLYLIIGFHWLKLFQATGSCKRSIWLLVGSNIPDSSSVGSHFSEAAVKSTKCFLYGIFGVFSLDAFGLKNTKCFPTFRESG